MSGISIPNILENRWKATREYVIENPISSAVYDLALKFFGFYCQSSFYPLGVSLAVYLVTASVVFDFAIFGQVGAYKDKFFASFAESKKRFEDKISNYYNDQISRNLKNLISTFFIVTPPAS